MTEVCDASCVDAEPVRTGADGCVGELRVAVGGMGVEVSRCARVVRALCARCARVVRALCSLGLCSLGPRVVLALLVDVRVF